MRLRDTAADCDTTLFARVPFSCPLAVRRFSYNGSNPRPLTLQLRRLRVMRVPHAAMVQSICASPGSLMRRPAAAWVCQSLHTTPTTRAAWRTTVTTATPRELYSPKEVMQSCCHLLRLSLRRSIHGPSADGVSRGGPQAGRWGRDAPLAA